MDDRLPQLRHRLLHRLARRYRFVTEPVQFGPISFPFTRIVDPDDVLNQAVADADLRDRLVGRRLPNDELRLPYWAEVWDSARGIGEYLVSEEGRASAECDRASAECRVQSAESREDSVPDSLCTLHSALCTSSLLDLGCGMGMAGAVAAGLGARVLFADLENSALLFAQLNSLPWRHRVRTRQLDWKKDRLDQRFDLILGADILYERAEWPWLHAFWRAHLAEGGQIILGEPGRQTGDLFVEWVTTQGWRLTMRSISVSTRATPIRIFLIS